MTRESEPGRETEETPKFSIEEEVATEIVGYKLKPENKSAEELWNRLVQLLHGESSEEAWYQSSIGKGGMFNFSASGSDRYEGGFAFHITPEEKRKILESKKEQAERAVALLSDPDFQRAILKHSIQAEKGI